MRTLIIAAAIFLVGCLAEPLESAPIQLMPYSTSGVRAGCIRTLARLAVRSQTAAAWSPDAAAAFCDEVERSYYEEIRDNQQWRAT